jgi:fucose permease
MAQTPTTAYSASRLFFGSSVALVVIGLSFAIRGDIIGELRSQFQLTNEQLGWIAGAAFWGYVGSIFLGGQLCDVFGMGRLLTLAFVTHIAGIALTIFANGFWTLWAATLAMGIAGALIEAAINPLIAALYPRDKTQKLNVLHSWFPWGIVLGGLAAYLMTRLQFGWQAKMGLLLVPTFLYGLAYFGQKFPPTERVAQGVSTASMYKEALKPGFLILVFSMVLTAATELGPNQWIPSILTTTAHMPGILVLVWINALMGIGRMAAGPVIHRLSPVGLLVCAAALATAGLLALSLSSSAAAALAAATVFAVGVCYFWPTMLGLTSERYAAGGALTLAIMGGAGNLSVALVLPLMGRVYDLRGPELALRYVAALPAFLTVLFTAMWIAERSRGRSRNVEAAAGAQTP